MPNNADKINSFTIHMILGLILFVFTFLRIWHMVKFPKVEPLDVSSFRQKLIKINHILIYVVIIAMGASGIVAAQFSEFGNIVFFWFV